MTKQADPNTRGNQTTRAKKRLRLTPDERIPQILDAALVEFSKSGFDATRMDDIAQRCGLSKGGLYAHFDSKDAIFKALIERVLQRTDWTGMPRLATGASPRLLAEWIVDRLHAALLTPDTLAVLKLLIPQRERVPASVQELQQNILRLRTNYVTQLLQDNLNELALSDSVLGRHPWLALSPLMHVLLWRTLLGDQTAPDPDFRQAHVDMLCALLDNPTSPQTDH